MASSILQNFYEEDPKGNYYAFYQKYRRRNAIIRGDFKETVENLKYGTVYQKWINHKKGLVEIPLNQITIASKFIFI